MIWFTSDLHLGHARALEFASRPWGTLDEMHDALVEGINAVVAPGDDLYVLGDLSFKATREEVVAIRRRIACERVHLVPGNHDRNWSAPGAAGTLVVEPPIKVIRDGTREIVLSHYPLADWRAMSHGSWHLHGHIHSLGPAYNELNLRQGLLRYDVGVDANAYAPVSLDELRGWFDGVPASGRVRWWDWVNQTGDEGVEAELRRIRGAVAEVGHGKAEG